MKFDWFDAKEVEAFGAEMAAFLMERIPPVLGENKRTASARNKDVIRKMQYKVEQFKARHGLNFYKKAKFGNAFQWALKDAGYEQAFVVELTRELLLKM